ncbi:hypothetical protein A2U01_0086120, partial [Trifolium medium]|nr:hypothetical protein [Trifolium medium]
MGQLSRKFSSIQSQGGFGGNTHDNPKNESCKAITLRSREVPSPVVVEKHREKKVSSGREEDKSEDKIEG